MDKKISQVPRGPFSFLLFTSKPYWIVAVLTTVFAVLGAILGALVPYIFKRIVDSINNLPGLGTESVWFWISLYIIFGFVEAMAYRAKGFAEMRWATGVRATGRQYLTEYVTKHSYGYFSNRFAGAIGSKLNNASNGLNSMVSEIQNWVGLFLGIAISFWLAFYTNIYVGMIFLVWLIVITPINIWLVRKKIPYGVAAQARETELRGQTVDVLTNIHAMHDYARRTFELSRFKNLIDIRRSAGLKNWMFSEIVLTVNSVLETFFVGGMIFVTVYLWNLNLISAGDIILILTLVISVRGRLAYIGLGFNHFAETISEVKEGLAEMLVKHEVTDIHLATNLEVARGDIMFSNVSFQYESQDIFIKLNFHIEPGQRIGLVGRSGAGKSTLMKLLMRQYDVSGGEILIDGQNIASVSQESLRDSIAVVPQDPLLFHRSLKDNIRYGKLNATDEEVRVSAEHAQAHGFIDALPKKYETLVGERGVKLSGGERQRVAIARAFLKNAKILLLDEATSSLDSENEMMIQKALGELVLGKTVVAIAHRLSTLRAMDRIVVIDNGQIVEDGTHDELLKIDGIYAELWSHQAGGFLLDE